MKKNDIVANLEKTVKEIVVILLVIVLLTTQTLQFQFLIIKLLQSAYIENKYSIIKNPIIHQGSFQFGYRRK